MFGERVVLFAHRDGVVLEDMQGQLPPLEVVGFLAGDADHGIDTVAWPPARYSWDEIEFFRPLRGLLRRAIANGDPGLLGRVATASARINQRFLPKLNFEQVIRLAEDVGAVGVQVAHSGTVMGLMFDADMAQVDLNVHRGRNALQSIGFKITWRFSINTMR